MRVRIRKYLPRQRQSLLRHQHMRNPVLAHRVVVLNPELLHKFPHRLGHVRRVHRRGRHLMIMQQDQLVGIEYPLNISTHCIEKHRDIDIHHHDVTRPDIFLGRMVSQNLLYGCHPH